MSVIRCESNFFGDELRQAAAQKQGAAQAILRELQQGQGPGGEFTGWYDWPRRHGIELAKRLHQFRERLEPAFDTVVVIGIGGSYLGARALYEATAHTYQSALTRGRGQKPQLIFAGHHLSEKALVETLDLLAERQPLLNVISKSGTTTEPALAFRVLRSYMEQRYGKAEAARRIIATTDAKRGALRRLADDAGYPTFEVPDDVGGRFSVLTAVGLLPLTLAGFNIDGLLTGAAGIFDELRSAPTAHPVIEYATLRHAAFEAGKRIDIMAYAEPRLAYFVEWWKQLYGESEGKDGKGLFPAGLAYSTDLHSLGQYVQDGARSLIETFLMIDDPVANGEAVERRLRVPAASDNLDELGYLAGRSVTDVNTAAMLGTMLAHSDGGVPALALRIPRLDAPTLGALIAFFECACGISARLLGVNPFDQPGVEAYKKNLFGLLGKPGFETLGHELQRRLR